MNTAAFDLLSLIRDPETGAPLEEIEPWLLSGDDVLFPVLTNTPVLQPHIDAFLDEELWQISRALAEYGEADEIREWYFSRHGKLAVPDPAPIDTDILGEGYPGFWDSVGKPDFLERLQPLQPEELILQVLGEDFRVPLGLDLGAGQGGMTQRMATHCENVIGAELNFYLAATANRLLPRNEIPLRWFDPVDGRHVDSLHKAPVHNAGVICGDARCLPFPEAVFDWVHIGHLLDLMDEPGEVLAHVMTFMKKGAWLTLCSPLDFTVEGHFDDVHALLENSFDEVHRISSAPWLRYRHKRRFVLHEDWIWIGRLKA
jgi:hypothetical protein